MPNSFRGQAAVDKTSVTICQITPVPFHLPSPWEMGLACMLVHNTCCTEAQRVLGGADFEFEFLLQWEGEPDQSCWLRQPSEEGCTNFWDLFFFGTFLGELLGS